jgi:hypothetical protein
MRQTHTEEDVLRLLERDSSLLEEDAEELREWLPDHAAPQDMQKEAASLRHEIRKLRRAIDDFGSRWRVT